MTSHTPAQPTAGRTGRTLGQVLRRSGWLPLALPGLLAVGLALLGPFTVGADATRSLGPPFQPPVAGLPLGTDHLGRDVWAVLRDTGARLVLLPVAATLLSTILGTTLGMVSGWYGGRVGAVALRAAELLLVIPPLLVMVVVLNATAGGGAAVLVALIALLGTPATTRFIRAATTTVVSRGYIEHAAALGERTPVLLARDVLPTITAPVLADAGLRLVGALYLTASVGFLGLGATALGESWATMVADNAVGASLNPWALVAPAACVVALAVSVNLVADRLADRFRRSM